jgi:hypothetical protein
MTIYYNQDGTRDVRLADGTWQQQRLGLHGWQPVEMLEMQDDNLRFFEGLVFAVTAVVTIGVIVAVAWSMMR